MKLTTINSNSAGNCYILTDSSGQSLILEAGVLMDKVKRALKFSFKNVVGCVVSHSHGDHCKAVPDILAAGIRVYSTMGELQNMGIPENLGRLAMCMEKKQMFTLGKFEVKFFPIHHDTPDPVGYLIRHPEMGLTCFVTDTYYCDYKFQGLNNIIIEANYSKEVINSRLAAGETLPFLRDRVIRSHLSIENCLHFLQKQDLSAVNNIVLIHLSNDNSNATQFKKRVEDLTAKTVSIAGPGLVLGFDKTPF